MAASPVGQPAVETIGVPLDQADSDPARPAPSREVDSCLERCCWRLGAGHVTVAAHRQDREASDRARRYAAEELLADRRFQAHKADQSA